MSSSMQFDKVEAAPYEVRSASEGSINDDIPLSDVGNSMEDERSIDGSESSDLLLFSSRAELKEEPAFKQD